MTILYRRIAPDNFSNYGVTKEPELPRSVSFFRGAVIEDQLTTPLVFEVNYPAGTEPPHLLGILIPIVSSQLLEVLRAAGVDNFQVFPAVLRNPDTGAEWGGFWAFNTLGLVSWVSMPESTYDTIMKGSAGGVNTPLLGFQTIVLDKNKTRDDVLMFRLAESPHSLLIHDRVYKHLVANTPPGKWRFKSWGIDVR